MLSPVSGFARMVRAGLIGVWVTLGACVGHVCGHGQLPPFIALAPVAGAAGCAAWFLTDRRIHLGAAALLILVPQAVVHVLACYVAGHGVVPSPLMLAAHAMATTFAAWGAALGDRAWWLVWAWLTGRRPRLVPSSGPRPAPVPVVPRAPDPATSHLLLTHVVVRRGPPACPSW